VSSEFFCVLLDETPLIIIFVFYWMRLHAQWIFWLPLLGIERFEIFSLGYDKDKF
jgi:hypothetical protein